MRTFSVMRFGEQPALHDLPLPTADGAYLIRVRCAGVNPVDSQLADRLTAASSYPFVLGIDFAGVVERAPSGASNFQKGDRVFGMARSNGSYAEYTAVAPDQPTEPLAHIPDEIADDEAAAIPIPGITALQSLELLAVRSGQRLVVMGATGGVGGFTVQMARARGAHVIATVRGDVDEARRLGADEVVDSQAVDVIEAIHAAHADGVDAVLDLVSGKDIVNRDLEILGRGGRLVSTRYAADESWFAAHRVTAYNISSVTNPLSSPGGLALLARILANGTISARIAATSTLDEIDPLLEQLRHGNVRGKAIIRL